MKKLYLVPIFLSGALSCDRVSGPRLAPGTASPELASSAQPADPPPAHPVLAGHGTATIDGVLSPGEWDTAATFTFDVNLPGGGTTPGTLYVMDDHVNMYVALSFARGTVDLGNSFDVQFDNDDSGFPYANGDDVLVVNPDFDPPLIDDVRTNAPPCPPGRRPGTCGFRDVDLGGTNDGQAAFHNDGATTVYELSHPLDSGDPNDFSLKPGDRVGMAIFVRMIAGSNFPDDFGDTDFPEFGEFLHIRIRG
ncbi:MAG: hypothetical protein ABR567_21010 [Myxococcales bacterium]|nr:hypothetical protein [Myxococcales bacterium]